MLTNLYQENFIGIRLNVFYGIKNIYRIFVKADSVYISNKIIMKVLCEFPVKYCRMLFTEK